MKKAKLINKKLIFLLIFILSLFVFAGCQNKSAANNTSGNTATTRKFNASAMKTKMQDSISPLVANNTITQAQEDKIVAALIPANTSRSSGQGNYRSQQTSQTNSQQSGQPNNAQYSRTNRQSTALAKLVTDNVITQAQADAVSQAIKTNTASSHSQTSGS
jgi:hypothetical protein